MQPKSVKKVIDSNALQSPELRAFLAKSPRHFAVLSDYTAMEAYKDNTFVSIFRSMEILSQFPRLVIVLKTTGQVCSLRGRPSGLQRRMINEEQTNGFPEYCRALKAAQLGDVQLQAEILGHGRVADGHMQKMLAGVVTMPEAILELRKEFKPDELTAIRTKAEFPESLIHKAVKFMFELTLMTIARHPSPPSIKNAAEMQNSFLFRHAAATFFWSADWIGNGGVENVRPDRLRNDMVDLIFATFATYFDDLLSKDEKALRIYRRVKRLMDDISPER